MITLVLAEDHQIVRQGLKALFTGQPGISVIGEASDGLEAIEIVARQRPTVLVLDLMLPRLHGLEVVRRVRQDHPATRVVMLSMYAEPSYVIEALRSGALGYVLKDTTVANLIESVRAVAAGKRYLSPMLTERTLDAVLRTAASGGDSYESLTERERIVLHLAAEGLSNPELAKRLSISPRTAESHRANLMRKLGLRSQTDLVRYAIRRKIIEP